MFERVITELSDAPAPDAEVQTMVLLEVHVVVRQCVLAILAVAV
jgi:hypothetical protein